MIAIIARGLIVMILKKLINKYLFPELKKLAEASENKIDDVLTDHDIVENSKKLINLGIDKINERL